MAKRKSVLEAVHTTARGLRKAGIMREQTIVKDTTWSRSSFKDESTQGGNMVAIEPLYTIGALARHSGCSVDTIRYYERMQLMPAVPRTAGGHRLYDGRHAARLAFIHRARALGLSLKQVRNLIDGVDRHACGCSRIRSLLEELAAEVDRRLADLQKLGRRLRTLIEVCGNATAADCRVVETLLVGGEPVAGMRCCAEPVRIPKDAGEREPAPRTRLKTSSAS